jgi:phage baseplate assembly protein W
MRYTGMMRLHPIAGRSEDGFVEHDKELIKRSVNTIIKTPKGSRVYDPDFGTNLHLLVNEPNIQRTRSRSKIEIIQAVEKYEPRAVVRDVNVVAGGDGNESEVVAMVKIEYVEYAESEILNIRMKKEDDWISTEGQTVDPMEEFFKNARDKES